MVTEFKKKKERVLESKPKHLIDACVIFGAYEYDKPELRNICERYMSGVGHKYNGFISFPIMGEILLALSRMKDKSLRELAFDFIITAINEETLNILSIPKENKCKIPEFFDYHQKIQHDDVCHLSYAYHHKIEYFVTTDNIADKKNKKSLDDIKKELNLWIVHPMDMIKKFEIRT